MPLIRATIKENIAELVIPTAAINGHLANSQVPSLMIEVTVQRSKDSTFSREFDVIVGAPPDLNHVDANSPYYAGTIAFFGSMSHMARMPQEASFVVPLPKSAEAFNSLGANESTRINVRVVPTNREGSTPVLKGVTLLAY
jgi:tyrosinase